MEVLDNIYQHSDSHEYTTVIHLYLQKAFDTENHSILIGKLNIYGVWGVILKWFANCLSDISNIGPTALQVNESDILTIVMANTAMCQLAKWFIANRLSLNHRTKTSCNIFGSKVNVLPGTKLCINCKEI